MKAIPKIPGFPYVFLVRMPLIYLIPTLVAGLLDWLKIGFLGLLFSFWDTATVVITSMVLVGVPTQFLWVPMGVAALLTSPIKLAPSVVCAHLLAILCGALQVPLLWWQIGMSVFS